MDAPLPNNLDAERSVLGAILLDNHALNVAIESLRPEDFFLEQHRRVFTQMIALGESQQAIDLVTLTEELHRKGDLEASGGAPYLASLADGMPKVSNIEHYARIVKEKAMLRNLIHATHDIQQRAFEGEDGVHVLLDSACETLSALRGARSKKSDLVVYTAPQVIGLSEQATEYVVYPLAVRGMLALVDGHAKLAGKTTLVMSGVRAELRNDIFLNRATKRVPVLLVSEENPRTLRLALERAGLAEERDFHVVPLSSFFGRPWAQVVEQVERKCIELRIGWLIFDTFYKVAGLRGDDENKAGAVDEAVTPIQSLAGRLDIAVTLTRHERKSGGEVGNSGRGSSALTGACDTVMLLRRLAGNRFPERRQLEVTGRVEQTQLEIELQDGRYRIVESADTIDEVALLDKAIGEHPEASVRELQRATGVGRNRVRTIAAKAGWLFGDSGWERSK